MQVFDFDSLPITIHRDSILSLIANNSIVIIEGETGSGKSTQVPKYCFEAGHKVLVTQPRIITAREISTRVAEELGVELGTSVGYKTSKESCCNRDTSLLFVTDGLAMVREIMGSNRSYDTLIIDEVHLGTINVHILMAWAVKEIENGAKFKLVLMSATIETKKLSEYCNNAPIVSVSGRMYPVINQDPAPIQNEDKDEFDAVARDITAMHAIKYNSLVFVAGKGEIEQLSSKLEGLDAEILTLHGEQTGDVQKLASRSYDRPVVIISTNVAETGLTVPGIDCVIDTGMERRKEINHGVEGLYLRPISKANSKQRMGRAGRCKPGIYINHLSNTVERPDYPVAEIQRTLLDQTVLRLSMAGFDLEQMRLFSPLDPKKIHQAKEVLKALGLMNNEGKVTEIGKTVSRLPCDVRIGRMLVEASKRNCLDDMLTIAAIMSQNGGIVDRSIRVDQYSKIPIWRRMITDTTSDALAMLAIFKQHARSRNWRELGLHTKKMKTALETRKQLAEAFAKLNLNSNNNIFDKDQLLKSILSGLVDQVRAKANGWKGVAYGSDLRKVSDDSVLPKATLDSSPDLVIGLPFDLHLKDGNIIPLLNSVSIIKMEWLKEMYPEMIREERDNNPRFSYFKMERVTTCRTYFGSTLLKVEETVADRENDRYNYHNYRRSA